MKEGLEQTFGVAEKSISEAEAWDKPDTLSDELEKATAEIQQSMVILHCFCVKGKLYRVNCLACKTIWPFKLLLYP